jgi:hypothetical protein
MQKHEALFTTKYVMPWIRSKKQNIVFEAKSVKTTVGQNDFEEQQLPSLHNAKHGCVSCKMPDGGHINLFDGFSICHSNAYVIVEFRGQGWCVIDIDVFMEQKNRLDFESSKKLSTVYFTY